MGLLGKLIVNIDADLTGLRSQIKAAERVMAQSAKTLGSLSASLTQAITLPFAAISVGAIKAAADLNRLTDGLQTTMLDAGRSVFSVQTEIEALRKAALAPGLDFEQAVKGSLRLQGVGLSAERAREILIQFGNAVAVAGGTADNLNSVTVQLAQIIGKGKILTQDLNIIKENMPSVAQAMIKAFGTADAEGIQKLGLSADVFVERLTKQLATLPRATGGLANAITNVFSAIKQSAADLGNILATKLNVTGKLEQLSSYVLGLADAFKALSPIAQDAVLGIAAFALALGPAIKVGSLLISTVGGISVVIAQMRQAMAAVQTGGLVGWWKSLNDVMKANVIGVVIGVALAAAAAFALLGKSTDAAAKTQQALVEINKQASDSVAEERVKVGLLVDVLKSETATRDEKSEALKKLNAIAPEYFKGLNAEKISVDQLNLAYDGYINSILRAARAKAAEGKLIELDKQAIEIAEKKNDALAKAANFVVPDRPRAANASGIGDLQDEGARAASLAIQAKANSDIQIKAFDAQAAAVKQQMDALKGLIKANTDLVPTEEQKTAALAASRKALEESAASVKAEKEATKEAGKQAKVYAEALADVQKEIDKAALTGADAFQSQADAIESGLGKLLDAGFSKGSKEVQTMVAMLEKLKATINPAGPIELLNNLLKLDKGSKEVQTLVGVFGQFETAIKTVTPTIPNMVALLRSDAAGVQIKKVVDLLNEAKVAAQGVTPLAPLTQRTPGAPVSETAGVAPVSPIAPVPQEVLDSYALLPEYLQAWQDKAIESQQILDTFWEANGAAMMAARDAMMEFGSVIESSLSDANTSWDDFGAAAKNAIVGVIGNLIKLTVASAITSAFKSSPNPLLGAGLAAIGGALAAGIFKRLVGAAKFAQGTLSAPGGLSLVGEEGPELLNVPTRSGIRIAAKHAGAVQDAIGRAVSGGQASGLSVVGQKGPQYIHLPRGAQVIPAPQTRKALDSMRRSMSGAASTLQRTLHHVPSPRLENKVMNMPDPLSFAGQYSADMAGLQRTPRIVSVGQTNIVSHVQGSTQPQRVDVEIAGELTARGSDLVLVLDKAKKRQTRVSGK